MSLNRDDDSGFGALMLIAAWAALPFYAVWFVFQRVSPHVSLINNIFGGLAFCLFFWVGFNRSLNWILSMPREAGEESSALIMVFILGIPVGTFSGIIAYLVICGFLTAGDYVIDFFNGRNENNFRPELKEPAFAEMPYDDNVFAFSAPPQAAPQDNYDDFAFTDPPSPPLHAVPLPRPATQKLLPFFDEFDPTNMEHAREFAQRMKTAADARTAQMAEECANDPELSGHWPVFMRWVAAYLRGEDPQKQIEHEKIRKIGHEKIRLLPSR